MDGSNTRANFKLLYFTTTLPADKHLMRTLRLGCANPFHSINWSRIGILISILLHSIPFLTLLSHNHPAYTNTNNTSALSSHLGQPAMRDNWRRVGYWIDPAHLTYQIFIFISPSDCLCLWVVCLRSRSGLMRRTCRCGGWEQQLLYNAIRSHSFNDLHWNCCASQIDKELRPSAWNWGKRTELISVFSTRTECLLVTWIALIVKISGFASLTDRFVNASLTSASQPAQDDQDLNLDSVPLSGYLLRLGRWLLDFIFV